MDLVPQNLWWEGVVGMKAENREEEKEEMGEFQVGWRWVPNTMDGRRIECVRFVLSNSWRKGSK